MAVLIKHEVNEIHGGIVNKLRSSCPKLVANTSSSGLDKKVVRKLVIRPTKISGFPRGTTAQTAGPPRFITSRKPAGGNRRSRRQILAWRFWDGTTKGTCFQWFSWQNQWENPGKMDDMVKQQPLVINQAACQKQQNHSSYSNKHAPHLSLGFQICFGQLLQWISWWVPTNELETTSGSPILEMVKSSADSPKWFNIITSSSTPTFLIRFRWETIISLRDTAFLDIPFS